MKFKSFSFDEFLQETISIVSELFLEIIKKKDQLVIVHSLDIDSALASGILYKYFNDSKDVPVVITDVINFYRKKGIGGPIIYLGHDEPIFKFNKGLIVTKNSYKISKEEKNIIRINSPSISSLIAIIIENLTVLSNDLKYLLLISSITNKLPLIKEHKLFNNLENILIKSLENDEFLKIEKGIKLIGWGVRGLDYSLSNSIDPPVPTLIRNIENSRKFVNSLDIKALSSEKSLTNISMKIHEKIKSHISDFNVTPQAFISEIPIVNVKSYFLDIYEGAYALTSLADALGINYVVFSPFIPAYINSSLMLLSKNTDAIAEVLSDISKCISIKRRSTGRNTYVEIVTVRNNKINLENISVLAFSLKALNLIRFTPIFKINNEYVISSLYTEVKYTNLIKNLKDLRVEGTKVIASDVGKIIKVLI